MPFSWLHAGNCHVQLGRDLRIVSWETYPRKDAATE